MLGGGEGGGVVDGVRMLGDGGGRGEEGDEGRGDGEGRGEGERRERGLEPEGEGRGVRVQKLLFLIPNLGLVLKEKGEEGGENPGWYSADAKA